MYSLPNRFDVWIYRHFPILPALSELILLLFPILRQIEKNNESYNLLLSALRRQEIEKWEINKIKLFCGFSVAVRPLVHVIANNYGYIAIGNKEISRVYANAPPTAPPKKPVFTEFQIYEILQSLIPPVLDELQEQENQLQKEEIRNYVIAKTTLKVLNNQHSYPLDFSNPKNFSLFEKNIKFCIIRQILPTLAIATKHKNKKAKKITKDAAIAWHRRDVDIDADLPAADGEKMRTYHDIIPGNAPEPLSILIQLEQSQAKQAALAGISETDKNRIIAEYDASRRVETGELFETEPTEPAEKPVNLNKYRRQPKPLAAAQPSLFIEGTL